MGYTVQEVPRGPLGIVNQPQDPSDDPPTDDPPPRGASPVFVYALAAGIVAADQVAKTAAVHWLRPVESVPVFSWLRLTWATNTGGAFGLMSTSTGLLVVIAAIVVVALAAIAPRLADSGMLAVGVACVLGGALGNLIDRARLGYVIDYLDLHFWPVFNIADIAITVGAGLLIIGTIIGHPPSSAGREDSD